MHFLIMDVAKEIKQVIDISVETIDAGTELAEHADISMQGIIDAVQKVSSIMRKSPQPHLSKAQALPKATMR